MEKKEKPMNSFDYDRIVFPLNYKQREDAIYERLSRYLDTLGIPYTEDSLRAVVRVYGTSLSTTKQVMMVVDSAIPATSTT